MPEWAYFTEDELRCHCGCGRCEMDPGAMEVFDLLRYQATQVYREQTGNRTAELPFIVTSGYRCRDHDSAIKGMGLHPQGMCIDISIQDPVKRACVSKVVFAHQGIVGVGKDRVFLHLDTVPRPSIREWVYNG